MDIEKIKKDLEKNLTSKRYEHSLLVADAARDLAKHYHIDENKAYLGGLIHDIAKDLNIDTMNEYVKKYNIDKSFLLPENIKIAHAEIGYFMLKEEYCFNEKICNAVRYHTTGDIHMDLFAKIIFIADKIGRREINPKIAKLKELVYQDIDEAMIYDLKILKEKLEREGRTFKGKSKELLEYLESKNN